MARQTAVSQPSYLPCQIPSKFLIHFVGRLAHIFQHLIGNMLRSYTKLSAYMIFGKFIKKSFVRVCQHIIETHTGTDKYFLLLEDPGAYEEEKRNLCDPRSDFLHGSGNRQ